MESRSSENEENNLDALWDVIRKRNLDHTFPAMADWIRETHKNLGKLRLRKRRNLKRLKWFAVVFLPVFLIVSCTYRIDRVEESGTLVNFSIGKQETLSFQKLSSLQQKFTFTCHEFLQPGLPGMAFFIFFIPWKEEEKLLSITKELQLLNGLGKLDISPVNYTIRESLFLTFFHETLKLGNEQKPKGKELAQHIQSTLKNKGLGFLSINILHDNDGDVAFVATSQKSDSSIITNPKTSADDNKRLRNDKVNNIQAGKEKLQIFNWLLGSWKIKYVPQLTYHYWRRINDSLLMCFIIKYDNDDIPDISVGFSIKYSSSDSAILSLRDIKWKFLSANDKEVTFKNEVTPKSANVKWALGEAKKNWQSVIYGEKNLEIVNLIEDKNTNLENMVNEFVAQYPEVIQKAHD